jgi:D-alanine-D-alanine ligase
VLGCRDAGRIDLRCDGAGKPQLMELNPLAGMHPEHSDLPMIATAVGISFPELVERIVRSACERVPGVDRQEVNGREGGGAAQYGVAGGGA